ncbi:MAG: DUF4190 domain-containing protein [Salinibacterium sp.]|nr:DUF4190 domain-containing protein [Salinibacterium sp.]
MTEPTPYAASMAPAAKWNVLSIVSLATSVLGLGLVGVITGHIALSQIKKSAEQGRVLAIIGLILGYLGIVIGVILGIFYIYVFLAFGNGFV